MKLKYLLIPIFLFFFFLTYVFIEKSNQSNVIVNNGFAFYENPTRHILKSNLLFSNGILELREFKEDKKLFHLEKAKKYFESSLGFMNQKKYQGYPCLSQIIAVHNQALKITTDDFTIEELYDLQKKYQKTTAKLEQATWTQVGVLYQLYITNDQKFERTIVVFGVILFISLLIFIYFIYVSSQNLKKSIDNFSELLNLTQEAIIIFDEKHQIVTINEAAKKIFDYQNDSFLGKDIFDFVPKEEIGKVQIALQSEKIIPYEINLYKQTGVIFPALASGGNIIRDGKKYRLSTIIDLTNLKEKEIQLIQQSRLATLGEMIGNIAHQWRQPLNLITTTISALEFKQEYSKVTAEDIKGANTTILNTANFLSETIETFRNFSKKEYAQENFNLSEVVTQAVDIVKASYDNNFITVSFDLDKSLQYYGDKNLLSQILLNLLGNAKDVLVNNNIEDKKVFISLSQESEFIHITVVDNGGGINDEVKNKIFDPYFTTKHQSQGTGLGLYMSKQIVGQYFKGDIEAVNSDLLGTAGASFLLKIQRQAN